MYVIFTEAKCPPTTLFLPFFKSKAKSFLTRMGTSNSKVSHHQGVARSPGHHRCHVGLTIADIIYRVFDFCPTNSVNDLATVAVLWHDVARTHPSWRTLDPDIDPAEMRWLSEGLRGLVLPCWSAESFDRAVQENRYSNGHAERCEAEAEGEEGIPRLTSMSLCVAVDTPHHWLRCDHEELVMSTDRQPTPSTIRTSVRGRHVSVKSSNSSGGNSSVCVEVLLDSCRLYSNFWRCCRADLKRQRFAVLLVCYEADAEEKCKIFASVTAFLREYLENNVQHHDDPIMCPQVMFVAMQRRSLSSTSSSSRTLVQSLAQCCNIPHVTIRCPVCFSPARHMITSHIAACAVTFYEMSRRRLKNNGSGQVLLPTAICPQKTQKCAVQ
eukprot:PhM_4_TR5952/c0_g1_i1/m.55188